MEPKRRTADCLRHHFLQNQSNSLTRGIVMSVAVPFDLAIFLIGTLAAAFVTGLAGFAFGMVAAGIWLFALTPVQTTTLIVAYALLVQGYSTWRLRRTIIPLRLFAFCHSKRRRNTRRHRHSRIGIGCAFEDRCRNIADRIQPLQSAATKNAGLEKRGTDRGCWHWFSQWSAWRCSRTWWHPYDLVVCVARLAPR